MCSFNLFCFSPNVSYFPFYIFKALDYMEILMRSLRSPFAWVLKYFCFGSSRFAWKPWMLMWLRSCSLSESKYWPLFLGCWEPGVYPVVNLVRSVFSPSMGTSLMLPACWSSSEESWCQSGVWLCYELPWISPNPPERTLPSTECLASWPGLSVPKFSLNLWRIGCNFVLRLLIFVE